MSIYLRSGEDVPLFPREEDHGQPQCRTLEATSAHALVYRHAKAPVAHGVPLDNEGQVATFLVPQEPQLRPGVTFYGSEPSLSDRLSQCLQEVICHLTVPPMAR